MNETPPGRADFPVAVHEAPQIARLGTLGELTLGRDFEAGPDLFAQFRES